MEDLKVRPVKKEELRKLFTEFEFSSMLEALGIGSEKTREPAESHE